MRVLSLPPAKRLRHIAPAKTTRLPEHGDMVDQVGRFFDAGLARAARAGQRQLDAFLSDLLGNPGRAFAEQAGGVAFLHIRAAALVDNPRKLLEPADAGSTRLAEAAGRAEM